MMILTFSSLHSGGLLDRAGLQAAADAAQKELKVGIPCFLASGWYSADCWSRLVPQSTIATFYHATHRREPSFLAGRCSTLTPSARLLAVLRLLDVDRRHGEHRFRLR